jgi:uridine kinase
VAIKELIKRCDESFEKRLHYIADKIYADGVRLISLSGPTCSGKTTAAAMLALRLSEHGKSVHIISIDDFYFDREYLHELSLSKGLPNIDYDSVDTIDLSALENFVEEMYSSDEVSCPVFDFKSGRRIGEKRISATDDDLFIFEGIQAIYPEVTALFAAHGYVSVYIAPQSSIFVGESEFTPNEIRLLRRIVRDTNFRGADVEFTLRLWESVRQNEDKNIFPFVDGCTYKIDSTQEYELHILKPFLENMLAPIDVSSKYYALTRRILKRLSGVVSADATLIGKDSLYREFV